MSENIEAKSRAASENESQNISIDFGDSAFQFQSNDFIVPDNRLDEPNALKNIDLTYYQAKCREILKKLYDNQFKNHKLYQDLRNTLLKNEL